METWSTKLELPADSVEFCPSQPECFVVGTYKLNEETRNRNGAVVAFRRTGDACDRVSVYEVPGVLDLKWSHDNLAVALSDGTVQVCRLLSTDNGAVNINTIAETGPSGAGSLALAVCWNSTEPEKLTTSYSNGEVSVLRFAESELEHERTWRCHDFEAWTVAWDSTDRHVFYTGGDDCLLKIWDTRSPEGVRTIRRHSMGVTAIQSHPSTAHLLATGGYDETVFFWDTRTTRTPVRESAVGGGVWRLKWNRRDPQLLAVAAMHGGACVLHYSADSQTAQCVSKFTKHESMVYGIDWAEDGALASCSFYDHSLYLWNAGL
ncbi:diphthine methyltransferase isoform X1 [Ixodes scapularis]